MVVNLAVHRKRATRVRIEEWLGAVLDVNDREPLVREYCALVGVYSAPVRPTVSDRLRHLQSAVAHQFGWFFEIKNPNKAAQSITSSSHLTVFPKRFGVPSLRKYYAGSRSVSTR